MSPMVTKEKPEPFTRSLGQAHQAPVVFLDLGMYIESSAVNNKNIVFIHVPSGKLT